MTKPLRDVGASVRQRLLNIAKLQKEDFQLVIADLTCIRVTLFGRLENAVISMQIRRAVRRP